LEENLLEDLELKEVKFGSVREFLLKLKNKFSRRDKKLVKVAECYKMKVWTDFR